MKNCGENKGLDTEVCLMQKTEVENLVARMEVSVEIFGY